MKKVWGKKFLSLLLAIFALAMFMVAVIAIGFQNDLQTIRLGDLYRDSFDGVDWAITTRTLLVTGIVISGIGMIIFFISTLVGRLLLVLDRIIWFIGIIALALGLVLVVAGEAYFATHYPSFKKIFDQGVFAGMLVATIVPSLIGISMGGYTLLKPDKK
jgi:hypothetical protein